MTGRIALIGIGANPGRLPSFVSVPERAQHADPNAPLVDPTTPASRRMFDLPPSPLVPGSPWRAQPDRNSPVADRSPVAKALIEASYYGGAAKMIFDAARVGVKLPEARANRYLGTAIRQMLTAAPTVSVIDPTAPARAVSQWKGQPWNGKTFTAFDQHAMRFSNFAGFGLTSYQLFSAVPSLFHSVRENGWVGLANTKEGRSGVLQGIGGVMGLGTWGFAMHSAIGGGARGLGIIGSAATQPIMGSKLLTGVGLGMAGLTMLNEWGAFDWMGKDNTKSVAKCLLDVPGHIPLIGSLFG